MTWDTERTERLLALHQEGKTASEIGAELGVTRNAVIGKLHRMGVTRKKKEPEKVEPEPKQAEDSAAEAGWTEKDDDGEDGDGEDADDEQEDDRDRMEVNRLTARNVEQNSLKLSLMELTSRTCKWPIGDPASDEFWFCGLPSTPGKPYCEAHNNLACQPFTSRRDRKLPRHPQLRPPGR